MYVKVCIQRKIPYETENNFKTVIDSIECTGIIKKEKKLLSLQVNEDELRHYIKDSFFKYNILADSF